MKLFINDSLDEFIILLKLLSPDCRVHNGACVDMACDYRMINNNYKHGVCKCKDGYYLDENQNCLGMGINKCIEMTELLKLIDQGLVSLLYLKTFFF